MKVGTKARAHSKRRFIFFILTGFFVAFPPKASAFDYPTIFFQLVRDHCNERADRIERSCRDRALTRNAELWVYENCWIDGARVYALCLIRFGYGEFPE